MAMMRWEPFPELMSLRQAMDKYMEDSFYRPVRTGDGMTPAVDMYQTPTQVVVKVAVPGVRADEIDVHASADGLTINGHRAEQQETKREDYFYQEQRYGSFMRYVKLPGGVATDKAEATLEDGVLTVTLPKTEEAKPKTVRVKQAKASGVKKIEAKTKKD